MNKIFSRIFQVGYHFPCKVFINLVTLILRFIFQEVVYTNSIIYLFYTTFFLFFFYIDMLLYCVIKALPLYFQPTLCHYFIIFVSQGLRSALLIFTLGIVRRIFEVTRWRFICNAANGSCNQSESALQKKCFTKSTCSVGKMSTK